MKYRFFTHAFLFIFIFGLLGISPQQTTRASALAIGFETLTSGLTNPVLITHAGDGSGRLFIVEQPGTIRIYENGTLLSTPFINLTNVVNDSANEQGLLALAFHPSYATNGNFYVIYTNDAGAIVLARYSNNDPSDNQAETASASILITIPHPDYQNHNGGMLAFGPDGFLYMSTGDGGSGGDPNNNAQDKTTLLGKLLRLDVDSASPYAIPINNPFYGNANAEVKQEIWAYGLRNPWRFSFDRFTGDLYIGDVGQNNYEEIDFQTVGSNGGSNYGWRILEGKHCYNPTSGCVQPTAYAPPIAEYTHALGCSITGGYVYRGAQFASMQGYYFYGDYCSGRVWSLINQSGSWVSTQIGDTDYGISSFGEGEDGELYLVDMFGGQILHIVEPIINTSAFYSIGNQDGQITESTEASAKGGSSNATNLSLSVGDSTGDRQVRGILSFDTSSLPNNAIIANATLQILSQTISGTNPFNTHGNLIVDIKKGFFGDSALLENKDFQFSATKSEGAKFNSTPSTGWYSAIFSSSVLGSINLTGLTQLRLRFSKDDNDDGTTDVIKFFSGNSTNLPVLTIQWHLP